MLHAVASLILVPPGSLFILVACGLLLISRKPLLGRALAWSGALLLLLLSLPCIGHLLIRAAGDFPPLSTADAGRAQAVVILAAEMRESREYGGHTVGERTMERLRYGARIARQTGLPLLLSGGHTGSGGGPASLAEMMQAVLREDYGLSARWLETQSRTTRENAQLSAPLLKADGVATVVLVTHESHMRRALREFERAGIRALPAPVGVPTRGGGLSWADIGPSPSAFRDSSLAIHELAGQVEQWVGSGP